MKRSGGAAPPDEQRSRREAIRAFPTGEKQTKDKE